MLCCFGSFLNSVILMISMLISIIYVWTLQFLDRPRVLTLVYLLGWNGENFRQAFLSNCWADSIKIFTVGAWRDPTAHQSKVGQCDLVNIFFGQKPANLKFQHILIFFYQTVSRKLYRFGGWLISWSFNNVIMRHFDLT